VGVALNRFDSSFETNEGRRIVQAPRDRFGPKVSRDELLAISPLLGSNSGCGRMTGKPEVETDCGTLTNGKRLVSISG
jgi:hypothetical protein